MIVRGAKIRLPGERLFTIVDDALPGPNGDLRLYVTDSAGLRRVDLTADLASRVEVLVEDGGADSRAVLAGLWSIWMVASTRNSKATALAATPLRPYPHQQRAVYEAMLPQPLLRFLLADEPGTGKTIMAGLWLREM